MSKVIHHHFDYEPRLDTKQIRENLTIHRIANSTRRRSVLKMAAPFMLKLLLLTLGLPKAGGVYTATSTDPQQIGSMFC